jgi:hypothetical protein
LIGSLIFVATALGKSAGIELSDHHLLELGVFPAIGARILQEGETLLRFVGLLQLKIELGQRFVGSDVVRFQVQVLQYCWATPLSPRLPLPKSFDPSIRPSWSRWLAAK